MIFEDNSYTDVGAFQLYGNAQDVVVSNNRFERSTGVFSWSLAESDHDYCPNLRVQIEGTRIIEGNHLFNCQHTKQPTELRGIYTSSPPVACL